MHVKVALCIVLTFLAGCTTVPEERLRLYGGAYAEMKRAAQVVYADYAAQEKAVAKEDFESAAAKAEITEYFELVSPNRLGEPVKRDLNPPTTIRKALAALDAGTIYNQALLRLASGESVGAVRESVAVVAGTVGSLSGVPQVGPVAGIIFGEIERARTRRQLVESLTKEYEIQVAGEGTRQGHLINLLLDVLIEHVDVMYSSQRERALLRAESLMFEEGNQAAAKAVADAFAQKATALAQYKKLLAETESYFRSLQAAAAEPSRDAQAIATARAARDLIVQARTVIALIGDMP